MASLDEDHLHFSKVKKGNLEAFEWLFRKYYPQLASYSTSILRNPDLGEEVAQEIFMYIWEKRQQIDLKSTLKGYLFSSAKNKCLNYIKLELPKLQSTTDLSGLSGMAYAEMTTDDTEFMKRKIQYAIDQLPEKCRNIFVLSRYGGLTYAEISEELEISVKTVENQMTIALRKLKELLSNELKDYNLE